MRSNQLKSESCWGGLFKRIYIIVINDDDLGDAANEDRGDSHDDAAKSRDIGSQLSLAS